MRRLLLALALVPFAGPALAQYPAGPTNQSSLALTAPTAVSSDSSNRVATTAYVQNVLLGGLPLASGKIYIGSVGNQATAQTPSGDLSVSVGGAFTLATVNANVGSFGSTTQCATITVNAKGLITAASGATCTPAIGSVTGLGTGVSTALGVNVGSAGAFLVNGGVLGTPSSGTLTNATGLPVSTGVSGLGAGVATFLATPSSANLRSALTDEVGTGAAYFVGGALGTPASGTATNLTGLPLATGVTGTLPIANGGTGDTGTAWGTYTASPTCVAGAGTWSTTSARFKQLGKTVFFQLNATITAIGTCSGAAFQFSLPTTTQSAAGAAGRETAVAGAPFSCAAGAASSNMICTISGAAIAVNDVFFLSGVYESQ
ncbi:hypothetical protein [Bradyrhizobium sp. Arg816]|uniref:hypothetical protein n=1 Tax=Bradyrhizobium sp. Arg816 TaxID=2998491 RepID=UPI00249F5AF7|nr:hypothetical protein [Bradyrhizobium sp. Arg816]MDI3563558.1 hypothetical protein [Bradyrhizobium sp. Arg816]